MIFVVLAPDRAGALEARLAHRQRHIEYWTGQPGVVKIAGAMLAGDTPEGSAFVIEAPDAASVRALFAADPFTLEGVFSSELSIQPIRPAIGEWFPGSAG